MVFTQSIKSSGVSCLGLKTVFLCSSHCLWWCVNAILIFSHCICDEVSFKTVSYIGLCHLLCHWRQAGWCETVFTFLFWFFKILPILYVNSSYCV